MTDIDDDRLSNIAAEAVSTIGALRAEAERQRDAHRYELDQLRAEIAKQQGDVQNTGRNAVDWMVQCVDANKALVAAKKDNERLRSFIKAEGYDDDLRRHLAKMSDSVERCESIRGHGPGTDTIERCAGAKGHRSACFGGVPPTPPAEVERLRRTVAAHVSQRETLIASFVAVLGLTPGTPMEYALETAASRTADLRQAIREANDLDCKLRATTALLDEARRACVAQGWATFAVLLSIGIVDETTGDPQRICEADEAATLIASLPAPLAFCESQTGGLSAQTGELPSSNPPVSPAAMAALTRKIQEQAAYDAKHPPELLSPAFSFVPDLTTALREVLHDIESHEDGGAK